MRTLDVAFASFAIAASGSGLACGGGSTPQPSIDAAAGIDAGSSAGSGTCTGSAYDPCTDVTMSTDCPAAAPLCKLFMGSGFTVCTKTCTTMADCPLLDGVMQECNTKGICKPSAANACTP